MNERAKAILDFWFIQSDMEDWFKKDDKYDEKIKILFLEDLKKAINNEYDDWQDTPKGCLALVVLLDQFSRNMFRGSRKSFEQDSKARLIVNYALKSPKDVVKSVQELLAKNNALTKEIEQYQKAKTKSIKNNLKEKIVTFNGTNFLSEIIELDGGSIKDILFQFRGEVDNFIGVIGGKTDGKCTLSIIASDHIVADKKFNAGDIIREVSKHIQGGGGGQPFFATAGGKNSEGLTIAIQEVKELIV